MYYLAYGSNLNLYDMKYRCPSAKPIGTSSLKGYRLVFKGEDEYLSFLTPEEDTNSSIPVGVFKISRFDEKKLDLYEGYPELYSKKYITIEIDNKKGNALIYTMNEGYDYHLPTFDYLRCCKEGYFNVDILDEAVDYTTRKMMKDTKKPISLN